MEELIILSNKITKEYFISTKYSNFGLGSDWIIQCSIIPKNSSNFINKIKSFFNKYKEIDHPIQQYQG